MKTSDKLQAARNLIEDPGRWCRYEFEDLDGRLCVLGAVQKIEYGDPEDFRGYVGPSEYLKESQETLYPEYVNPAVVNNEEGHEATLVMLDVAISMAMSDETAR